MEIPASLLGLYRLTYEGGLSFRVGVKGEERGKLFFDHPSEEMVEAWRPVLDCHGWRLVEAVQPLYDAKSIRSGEINACDLDMESRRKALRVLSQLNSAGHLGPDRR